MDTNICTRRGFLKTAGLAGVSLTLPGCASNLKGLSLSRKKQPNIIFILIDDLGWADVGYHDSDIMTPNIDRLAITGMQLQQHYVMPSCSPTRTCLMSGRYSSRFGVLSPTNRRVFDFDQVTLASALRSAGYETSITGKWHLGSLPEWGARRFGFDHSYGSFAGGVHPYTHRYKKSDYSHTWHRDDKLIDEKGHVTDLIGNEAVKRIEASAKSDKPFFLYVPFTAVHIPIEEPDRWTKLYEGRIADEARRNFAACATHMDDVIGRMLDTLQRTGQRDNTLIIFASDNGGQQFWQPKGEYPGEKPEYVPTLGINRPLRGWKNKLYEGGIRTPAMVNWPGRIKPGRTNAVMHIVDWMPTLCNLAGYKPDRDLKWDGQNIWPLINSETETTELRTLYWKTHDESAIRHGDWKLIINHSSGKKELFNIAADPYEENDLFGQHADLEADLMARLEKHRKDDAKEPLSFF